MIPPHEMNRSSRGPLHAADVALGAVVAIGVVVVGGGAAVVELAAAFAGHNGLPLDMTSVARGVSSWHDHLGDPRAAFAAPLRSRLPGPLGMYGAVALVALVVIVACGIGIAVYARRPSMRERHRDERRRRGLVPVRRLVGAFPQMPGGLVLGRSVAGGKVLHLPVERSLGAVMAPRTGKSSSAVGHVLDAPGPVLATSSKAELLYHTAELRETRTGETPLAYDPLGICAWPVSVRWNPVSGCDQPPVAMRRAEALMAGTGTSDMQNGGFWRAAGTMLLRCVLHACALEGAGVRELRQWVTDPHSGDLADVLAASAAAKSWFDDAALMSRQYGETVESVSLTTAVALDCLALPEVARNCSPPAELAFHPASWLEAGHGTLHVVAPDAEAASVAPLTAAFVDEVVIQARRLAAATPGGRLDPPLRLVLDELPNICPLPRVVDYVSDGGGRGIQIAWYAQSRHQLVRRFGQDGARVLLDATSAVLYSGGLQDADLLRDLSSMLGQLELRQRTWGSDRWGQSQWSEQIREVPVMEPSDIFALPSFQALLLTGGVGGAVVQLLPWWERPDAAEVRAAEARAATKATGATL